MCPFKNRYDSLTDIDFYRPLTEKHEKYYLSTNQAYRMKKLKISSFYRGGSKEIFTGFQGFSWSAKRPGILEQPDCFGAP